MSLEFIFSSGIIVVILFLIGLIFTFREFKDMSEDPESFRRRHDTAVIESDDDKD